MGLPDALRTQLERQLLQQRSELDIELARLQASLTGVRAARGDASADDEHDPDGTPLSAEWSRIAGVHSELVTRSEALDRALARAAGVAQPEYGLCVRCARPIGFARLEALPAAELCIACAELLASRRR